MPQIWTAPITWAVDQLVTDDDLNEQVRDNLEFLHGSARNYVYLRQESATGVAGGTFTTGAWQVRTLTHEIYDYGSLCALVANQFTLQPGVWRFSIRCPAANCNEHQARLYNVTAAAVALEGVACRNPAASNANGWATICGVVTIAVATVFQVEHRCATTAATNGFGYPASLGTEIYTEVEAWRLSS